MGRIDAHTAPDGAPFVFSLDGHGADLQCPENINTHHVRNGEAPLCRMWWALVWNAACHEVLQRYGSSNGIVIERTDGDHVVSVQWTLHDLYKRLPGHFQPDKHQEMQMRMVYVSLADAESRAGRCIGESELGSFNTHGSALAIFDRKTLAACWRHVELACAEPAPLWRALQPLPVTDAPSAAAGSAVQGGRYPRPPRIECYVSWGKR